MNKVKFGNKYGAPICLALGFFDSVHFGHRIIIEKMHEKANSLGVGSAVFTFENGFDKQIYTFEERENILGSVGTDLILTACFDDNFKKISAEDFLKTLFEKYDVRAVFCGYDYRFGHMALGDVRLLREFCERNGTALSVVPEIDLDGRRVSTTYIKELLSKGDVIKANRLLSAPFHIVGNVMHGRNVGHIYDMPTANIELAPFKYLPKHGVYATFTEVGGKRFKSVTNIGSKPTFGESAVGVETMLDGFVGNLYGKTVRVEFCAYLRDIAKFDSPEMLSEQIHKDIGWRL